MMKNTHENTKTKNNVSLIIAILGVIVCLVFIVMMMFPGGNDVAPDPTPTPDPNAVAREYWTVELEFYSYSVDLPLLKKVSVNNKGDVLKIESVNPSTANSREKFFYENGKLEHSETYSVNPISYVGKDFSDEKLYETRYVYMGDIVTKAEVYVNGTPTRSYDKYVYKVGGELDSIERYEQDKLEITYFYNGKDYPERVEHTNGRCYDLEYDENGNLMRVTGEDYLVEIDYENGNPTRFYKAYYDRKGNIDDLVASSSKIAAIKYERIKTFDYGEGGEIVKESLESVSTTITYVSEEMRDSTYLEEFIYAYDAEGNLTDAKHCRENRYYYNHRYSYDSEGNIICDAISADEKGSVFERIDITRINDNGLTVDAVHYYPYSGASYTESYKYDKEGNLVKKVYDDVYEETYEYYPSGAKKKYTRVMEKYSETWTYAENGNLEKYEIDYYDSDDRDYITDYITSDVYYGFMRREGSSDTFSLPQTVTYYSSGEYRVYEYDEKGVLQTDVLYDADGNVITQYYPEGK